MNAIPGRHTLGRALGLIANPEAQRAMDRAVIADLDAARDLRDAATRFHSALSQTAFAIAPPVDLELITAATAGLARIDLDAYQRRIADQEALAMARGMLS